MSVTSKDSRWNYLTVENEASTFRMINGSSVYHRSKISDETLRLSVEIGFCHQILHTRLSLACVRPKHLNFWIFWKRLDKSSNWLPHSISGAKFPLKRSQNRWIYCIRYGVTQKVPLFVISWKSWNFILRANGVSRYPRAGSSFTCSSLHLSRCLSRCGHIVRCIVQFLSSVGTKLQYHLNL